MSVVSQLLPFCTQVPWYAVLGNHDYGDMLSSGLVGSCNGGTLAQCKGSCCYSPLWQVGVQYIDAKPDLHACFAYILLQFTMRLALQHACFQLMPLACYTSTACMLNGPNGCCPSIRPLTLPAFDAALAC